jgi:hypothetical protein
MLIDIDFGYEKASFSVKGLYSMREDHLGCSFTFIWPEIVDLISKKFLNLG